MAADGMIHLAGTLTVLVAVLSLAVDSPGQLFTGDEYRSANAAHADFLESGGSYAWLEIPKNSTAKTCQLIWHRDGPDVTVQLPFHRVGGLVSLGGSDFLTVGRVFDPTDPEHAASRLVRFSCEVSPTPHITLHDNLLQDDIDPISLVYNPVGWRLFAVDFAAGRVMSSTWTGIPATLPRWTDEALAATAFEALAPLGQTILLELARDESDAGALIFPGYEDSPTQIHRIYVNAHGQWQLDDVSPPPRTMPAKWFAVGQGHLGHSILPVGVSNGGLAGAFRVLDTETMLPVASGDLTDPGSIARVAAPPLFFQAPGRSYVITGAGARDSRILWPLVRYSSLHQQGTLTVGNGAVSPLRVFAGNTFAVLSRRTIDPAPTPSSPQDMTGYLTVGFRDDNGEDPIYEVIPGAWIIQNPLVAVYSMPLERRASDFAGSLLIPPIGLAGRVLLIQWIVILDDGVTAAGSDIIGVTIRNADGTFPGGRPSSSTQGQTSGGSSVPAQALRDSLTQANENLKDGAEARALLRGVQAALRRSRR